MSQYNINIVSLTCPLSNLAKSHIQNISIDILFTFSQIITTTFLCPFFFKICTCFLWYLINWNSEASPKGIFFLSCHLQRGHFYEAAQLVFFLHQSVYKQEKNIDCRVPGVSHHNTKLMTILMQQWPHNKKNLHTTMSIFFNCMRNKQSRKLAEIAG